MGRQPFGLASAAAWLEERGVTVTCQDLSRQPASREAFASADVVAFHLPMHTATRLAAPLISEVRALNPTTHLCSFGLYAPMNEPFLRALGVDSIIGGEFEAELADLVDNLRPRSVTSLERLHFRVPSRTGLPPLRDYAAVLMPDGTRRVAGYTEASRGCRHFCRHCPIVPVYQGAYRVVQPDIVLADVAQQVADGAEHITFGDPDFFNGPAHAIRLVEQLHERYPNVTYDVTIKVEHLLRQSLHLPRLRDTGCLFVTTAVESIDDAVLGYLDKGHTRDDVVAVAQRFSDLGLTLNPTFVAFHPWLAPGGFEALLDFVEDLDLVENVSPIQWTIRLLLPAGSLLIDDVSALGVLDDFDDQKLSYSWRSPDPAVDRLHRRLVELVTVALREGRRRREVFAAIRRLVAGHDSPLPAGHRRPPGPPPEKVPYLLEPWYC